MKKIFLFLLAIACVTGCERNPVNPDQNKPELRPLKGIEPAIINSSNEFAFSLWHQLAPSANGENSIISPFSISSALAMAQNGANGNTQTAILKTLNLYAQPSEDINTSFMTLKSFLLSLDKLVTLDIANSAWYHNKYHVKKPFEDILKSYYDAGIGGLDFNDPASKNTINSWIEDSTHGNIRNMIDHISEGAPLYLINAIYFKAEWMKKFDQNKTKKGTFIMENGNQVQVDMMDCDKAEILLYKENNISLIDIPYGNGQYAMSILLPEANDGFENISSTITNEQYEAWLSQADRATCEIIMPKFTITSKINLNTGLSAMGMGIAFSDSADFSNLFKENLPLSITQILHQAMIVVNEDGTEASAATVVEFGITSAGPSQVIEINRPFMFLIHERYTNTIFFMGKVMNPDL
jgi:serine protease inhibitor